MSSSPTELTHAECAKRGWLSQTVEYYNAHIRRRCDLFGVIDIVAVTPTAILGIQTTDGSHHANRRAKILAEPRIKQWLAAGGLVELWSFTKPHNRWVLRTDAILITEYP